MRVVAGLGVVVGLALLVWPVSQSQVQWIVTVGDEAPFTTTVGGDKTAPAIQVLARSVSEGSPRTDAAVLAGVGFAAIALGVVGLLKARDSNP